MITCFRHLGMTSLEQIERMTLREYGLRLEAKKLSDVDKDFWVHWQAYLSFCATAKTSNGKKERPVYGTFKKFFDYENELKNVKNNRKPSKRFEGIGRIMKKHE